MGKVNCGLVAQELPRLLKENFIKRKSPTLQKQLFVRKCPSLLWNRCGKNHRLEARFCGRPLAVFANGCVSVCNHLKECVVDDKMTRQQTGPDIVRPPQMAIFPVPRRFVLPIQQNCPPCKRIACAMELVFQQLF